jgi:hypothetical protein
MIVGMFRRHVAIASPAASRAACTVATVAAATKASTLTTT